MLNEIIVRILDRGVGAFFLLFLLSSSFILHHNIFSVVPLAVCAGYFQLLEPILKQPVDLFQSQRSSALGALALLSLPDINALLAKALLALYTFYWLNCYSTTDRAQEIAVNDVFLLKEFWTGVTWDVDSVCHLQVFHLVLLSFVFKLFAFI